MSFTTEIPSPCVSVCTLDENSGYCKGCWRTPAEIAQWGTACATERLAILERLKSRQADHGIRRRRPNRRRS